VDLERRQPVDLLPDRTAETVAAWLRDHPGVEVIARDRAGAYAEGARQGAPAAVQVADRYHLVANVGDAFERVLQRHAADLRLAATTAGATAAARDPGAAPAPAPSAGPPAAPSTPTPEGGTPAGNGGEEPAPRTRAARDRQARRGQRQARYAAVVQLAADGWSLSGISRQLGLTRLTVRRYLRAGAFPEPAARPTLLSEPSRYAAHLRQRWAEGCQDAATLWRELRAMGFAGSAGTVRRHVAEWRTGPCQPGRPARGPSAPVPAPALGRVPAPRRVRWWLLRAPERLRAEQQGYRERLLAQCPAIAQARTLTLEFGRLVRERDAAGLAPWLAAATASGLVEFQNLAIGIERDRAAVEAALQLAWSNGQTEGQITKLKLLKRQGYGRAGLPLLRARLLRAA
jgi:transposase